MRRRAISFIACLCALILATCARVAPPSLVGVEITPELRAIMEAGRAAALPPLHPDFREIAAGLLSALDPDDDARVAELVRLGADPGLTAYSWDRAPPSDPPFGAISREDAAEDARLLFDIMRNGYTGYGYFGGDAAFLPALDSALARLDAMESRVQKSDFLNVLVQELGPLIADNHFLLHNVQLGALNHVPYMNDEIVMRRAEDGRLLAEIDGNACYVLGAELGDGTPVDAIMPTLTREGEIAWIFGRLMGHPNREIVALLEDAQSGERFSRPVSLSRVEGPGQGPSPGGHSLLSAREENGATILVNRSMFGDWPNDGGRYEAYEEFYRSGLEMRDRPVLILDIRHHGGGYSYMAYQWIRAYAGLEPSDSAAFMEHALASLALDALSKALYPVDPEFSYDFERTPDWWGLYDQWAEDPDRSAQWILPDEWDGGLLPNENLVIVLVDYYVASAGEALAGYLRQLENVLFVGTNTRGVLVTGGVVRAALPRSGLFIQLGTSTLNLRPDLSPFEGVGLLPDLWVPPGESLERVLAFVERYGIIR
ncbi:MAG: S41 family peptidase [Treponema sp.]|nr:S41 family peptidase [Treponema sp.]